MIPPHPVIHLSWNLWVYYSHTIQMVLLEFKCEISGHNILKCILTCISHVIAHHSHTPVWQKRITWWIVFVLILLMYVYHSQGEQMCFPSSHHKPHTQCGIHTFSGKDEGYQAACNLSSNIMESLQQQNRDSKQSKQTNRQKKKVEQWI